MPYNYEVRFNLDDCIKTLGLQERGKVQQFVTNEVLRLSEPYTPFDISGRYAKTTPPHTLIDSGHIENETDVVWRTPYARYLYYHPEFNYQGATMRGAYWVDRMLQSGGLIGIENGARRIVHR